MNVRPHRVLSVSVSPQVISAVFVVVGLIAAAPEPAAAQTGQTRLPLRSPLTFSFAPADGDATPASTFLSGPAAIRTIAVPSDEAAVRSQRRPVVIQYSDAYRTRARIHRAASILSLPLFVAEGFVGESLYRHPTPGRRSAHLALAAGIGGLFAVNTVTGVWNLIAARKDPNDRGRRSLHGVLMLAADAGFLATAALAPEGEEGRRLGVSPRRGAHRAVALASIGLATAGYLVMLLGGR